MPSEAEIYVRTDIAEIVEFYNQNYDTVESHFLGPEATKKTIGSLSTRTCRFCGGRAPDVGFRNVAHAIPELLGNSTLFSAYECNACNHLFGKRLENDLGIWSKPARTLTRIRGKNGEIAIKKGSSGGWRIKAGPTGFTVDIEEADPVLEVDENAKTVTFRLRRDPYTPVAVLKAFVKTGLTLLPEEEIVHFRAALRWISDPDHSRLPWKFPVFYTFQPGPPIPGFLVALVLRRKAHVANLPYAFLVLNYGNEAVQVMLPSPEKDAAVMTSPPRMRQYPVGMDFAANLTISPFRTTIDLCRH